MILLSKEELCGQFDPSNHPEFKRVIPNSKADQDHYLRKHVADAFEQMREAALPDGIELKLVSSTRNFERQKSIWENKWNGISPVNGTYFQIDSPTPLEKAERILKYSAMPGTSRHHWGTDIDINSVEEEYFETTEGRNVYLWLKVNARRFGFGQPYTAKSSARPIGYEEEKWHWSYLPLSRIILKHYLMQVVDEDLTGFDGSELAPQMKIISTFVNGIDSSCR